MHVQKHIPIHKYIHKHTHTHTHGATWKFFAIFSDAVRETKFSDEPGS